MQHHGKQQLACGLASAIRLQTQNLSGKVLKWCHAVALHQKCHDSICTGKNHILQKRKDLLPAAERAHVALQGRTAEQGRHQGDMLGGSSAVVHHSNAHLQQAVKVNLYALHIQILRNLSDS